MSNRSILEAIQQMSGSQLGDTIKYIPASVTSVDLGSRSCTCTPLGDTAQTDIVAYLMAEVDDGLLYVPTIGSTVIICYSTKNLPYIALFSQLDFITLVASLGIQLQGNNFGGIPIAQALANALNTIIDAFNLLNTKVNTLAPTPVIPPLIDVIATNLENQSVQHGS